MGMYDYFVSYGTNLPMLESKRIEVLRSYQVVGTLTEKVFDDVIQIAMTLCDVSIAAISFIDDEIEWFKSRTGTIIKEIPREESFYDFTQVTSEYFFEIEDTSKDDRYNLHPMVKNAPFLSSYLGVPIVSACGCVIGSLSVMDTKPRLFTLDQKECLRALSGQVVSQLELRKENRLLRLKQHLVNNTAIGISCIDEDAKVIYFNESYKRFTGFSEDELRHKYVFDYDPFLSEESWIEHWQDMKNCKRKTIVRQFNRVQESAVKIELNLSFINFEDIDYITAICYQVDDGTKITKL